MMVNLLSFTFINTPINWCWAAVDKTKTMFPNRLSILIAVIASCPFLFLGYDVAVISGNIMIQATFSESIEAVEDHNRIITFCSSFAAGLMLNYFGRKYPFAGGSAFYVTGLGMVCLVPTFSAYKVGRAFMAVGLGVGMVIGPIMIAEIAPARYRGLMGCFPQLFLYVGNAMGYALWFAFRHVHWKHGWRIMMGLPLIPSIAFMYLSFRRLPESPCLMAVIGRLQDVETLLKKDLQTPQQEVDERILRLRKAANIPDSMSGNTRYYDRSSLGGIARMWGELFRDSLDTFMFVTILHFLRVMSGEYSIFSHMVDELEVTEPTSLAMCVAATLMLVVAKIVVSVILLLLVDRFERKRFLVISMCMVMVASGAIGVSSILSQRGLISKQSKFDFFVGGALLLEAGVALGLGGIPWLYGPEAFKLPARAVGVGAAVTFGQFLAWYIDTRKVSLYTTSLMKADNLMLLSAGLMMIGILICCRVMKKETMSRKTLIDADLEPPPSE
ncbi:Putative polyol transporter 1 [Linum perenne]